MAVYYGMAPSAPRWRPKNLWQIGLLSWIECVTDLFIQSIGNVYVCNNANVCCPGLYCRRYGWSCCWFAVMRSLVAFHRGNFAFVPSRVFKNRQLSLFLICFNSLNVGIPWWLNGWLGPGLCWQWLAWAVNDGRRWQICASALLLNHHDFTKQWRSEAGVRRLPV